MTKLLKNVHNAFEIYVAHPDTLVQAANRFAVATGLIVFIAATTLALILDPFISPFFWFQAAIGAIGLVRPIIRGTLNQETYLSVSAYAFVSPLIFWILVGPQASLTLYTIVTASMTLMFFRRRDIRSIWLIGTGASAAYLISFFWTPTPLITSPPGYEVYTRTAIDGFVIAYVFVFAFAANSGYNASETQLRRARDQLKKERDRAREASRAREEFLAMISHEFRTPLTTLISTAKVLSRRKGTNAIRPELEAIETSSQSLLLFFENALDHARYSSGKFIPTAEELNLRTLAKDVISILSVESKSKNLEIGLEVSSSCPPVIISDHTLLHQVLLNLVSNALKHTNKGRIDIEFDMVGTPRDSRLIIRVRDTGIGIPAAHQDTLFDPFSRYHTQDTKAPGIGLGLAICKRIVETLNGTISVESASGEGSTFSVEIPIVVPATIEGDTSQLESAPLPGLSLLLVEDHAFIRLMLKEQLQSEGVTVTDVSSAKAAIEAVAETRYDLIMTDIFLPDASGFELATRLRVDDTTTPIIALSASLNAEDRKRCYEASINEVMTKPLSIPVFRRIVAKVLSEARSPLRNTTP